MRTFELQFSAETAELIRVGLKDLIITIAPVDTVEPGTVAVGDIYIINNKARRLVVAIRRYSSLKMMLEHEDHERIFTGLTKNQTLIRLRADFGTTEKYDVVVHEIVPLLRLVKK